ncbi:hypothetical protein L596_023691 [Steinernema carpocapsae]|uniref:Uncharacterized protein n=1 Tax=Steinernema carpocapsae TaxID=34508 RepID=A0A4U5MEE5_STECR|nr:hypothetical protein L596_023691 [Steinernema carpocapsae]
MKNLDITVMNLNWNEGKSIRFTQNNCSFTEALIIDVLFLSAKITYDKDSCGVETRGRWLSNTDWMSGHLSIERLFDEELVQEGRGNVHAIDRIKLKGKLWVSLAASPECFLFWPFPTFLWGVALILALGRFYVIIYEISTFNKPKLTLIELVQTFFGVKQLRTRTITDVVLKYISIAILYWFLADYLTALNSFIKEAITTRSQTDPEGVQAGCIVNETTCYEDR